ncbi:MAG: type II CAAX endopeptidase family protein [Pyrinomonadaceae bacterium]
MKLESIFLDDRNIPRSGWRFAIFVTIFSFTLAFFSFGTVSLLHALGKPPVERSLSWFVTNGAVSLLAALIVGWLCGKFLERIPFRALGAWFTNLWLEHLTLGVIIGAATILFAVLVAMAFGGLRFTSNPDSDSNAIIATLSVSLLVFAVGAAFEEALFRGYILQTFNRSGLAWLAIILTSVFFGLAHIRNPNPNILSTINTILAGVWFSVAYLKTRDLWFAWGMHLVWNWIQGAVFGIEVSGLTFFTPSPLLKEIDKGPTWLTGETYGIEGGIACTIALIISTAIIYFLPVIKPSEEMLALTSKNFGVAGSAGSLSSEMPTKAGTPNA